MTTKHKCSRLTNERRKTMEQKRLTIEVPTEMHTQAKSQAYAEGKTLKTKLIELIRDWLRKE